MTKLKGQTPQERGYDFEKVFGEALGIKPTPGSGNLWFAKMDLASSSLLISCKHTDAASFRVTRNHLREVQAECSGEQEPVLAVSIRGEVYVVQRAGDWLENMTGDVEVQTRIEPSKSRVKRETAKVPYLLRSTSEEDGEQG